MLLQPGNTRIRQKRPRGPFCPSLFACYIETADRVSHGVGGGSVDASTNPTLSSANRQGEAGVGVWSEAPSAGQRECVSLGREARRHADCAKRTDSGLFVRRMVGAVSASWVSRPISRLRWRSRCRDLSPPGGGPIGHALCDRSQRLRAGCERPTAAIGPAGILEPPRPARSRRRSPSRRVLARCVGSRTPLRTRDRVHAHANRSSSTSSTSTKRSTTARTRPCG